MNQRRRDFLLSFAELTKHLGPTAVFETLAYNEAPFTLTWWQEVAGKWEFRAATSSYIPDPVKQIHAADIGLWGRELSMSDLELLRQMGVGSNAHPARVGRTGLSIMDYKDRHKGERGFVLGNGPSLNNYDLAELSRFISIGMNRTCTTIKTTYYCCLDDVWIGKCGYENERLFTHPNAHNRGVIVKAHPEIQHWSWDLVAGASYRNTGLFALQIAAWMGLSPIYLLGFDGLPAHFDGTPAQTKPKLMLELMKEAARKIPIYTCLQPDKYATKLPGLKYVPYEEATQANADE